MIPEYIVVQAGGKGARLQHLTRNKPKALVPVDNLPMLFHLFRKYPDSKYIVIGDYKFDVLERYLAAFGETACSLVNASGHTGTCAGMREAFSRVPEGKPFLVIWSDLVLPDAFVLPEAPGDYVGVAKDFPCRWSFAEGVFTEERSDTQGVAGLFLFRDAAALAEVPEDGEFVHWLSESGRSFRELPLYRTKEYGLLAEYEKLETTRCRPFNRIEREGELLVKQPIDTQGAALAAREKAWYRTVAGLGFSAIPHIASYDPLKREYIDGAPVYETTGLNPREKRQILRELIDSLKRLHRLAESPADRASYEEAYIGKTFKRLEKVRELVPFAKDTYITVNGRRCRNVFDRKTELCEAFARDLPQSFCLIHGDCTFSNIMLRRDRTPVLIDPRGYFGFTELYGDPAYDWAKLYYSLAGNYDTFNRKHFSLDIGERDVRLEIASNGWEDLEQDFFALLDGEAEPAQIKLIHAVIWLSLTTYAWENYDSVCGAFYNGLTYLEEALT